MKKLLYSKLFIGFLIAIIFIVVLLLVKNNLTNKIEKEETLLEYIPSQSEKDALDNYLALWDEVFALEEDIINNSVFELDKEAKSYELVGLNEKHILKDQNGQRWMFKTTSLTIEPVVAEKLSRFLRICGFRTPVLVAKEFNINGTKYIGSIQKFVNQDKEIAFFRDLLIYPEFVHDSVLAQEIITYLFAAENEFLWTKDKELYFIDLNNIYLFPNEGTRPSDADFLEIFAFDSSLFLDEVIRPLMYRCYNVRKQAKVPEKCELWFNLYDGMRKIKSQSRDLTSQLHGHLIRNGKNSLRPLTAKILNFVDMIPNSYIETLMDDKLLPKSSIYDDYINTIYLRKSRIKKIFTSFYQVMPNFDSPKIFKKRYTESEIIRKTELLSHKRDDLKVELTKLKAQELKQPAFNMMSYPEAYVLFVLSKAQGVLAKEMALKNLRKMEKSVKFEIQKRVIRFYIDSIK